MMMPKLRGINFKRGFFPGNFDLLHPGHVLALEEARKHCDYLVVGLKRNNDDLPNKNQPIMSVKERIIMLEALMAVDEVLVYGSEKELHAIDATDQFDVRFIGNDHKTPKHKINCKLVFIPRDHDWSSTNIRKRIENTFNRK